MTVRAIVVGGLGAVGCFALMGCGSDDNGGSSSGSTVRSLPQACQA